MSGTYVGYIKNVVLLDLATFEPAFLSLKLSHLHSNPITKVGYSPIARNAQNASCLGQNRRILTSKRSSNLKICLQLTHLRMYDSTWRD